MADTKFKLKKAFLEGLQEKWGLTYDDLINDGYKYAGGTPNEHQMHHARYFDKMFPNKSYPEKEDYCVCGHNIKHNCYITNRNKEYVIPLGNCCIKNFMPDGMGHRTCENCEAPHKNRKDNLCKNCRIEFEEQKRKEAFEEYKRKEAFEEQKRKEAYEEYKRKKAIEEQQRKENPHKCIGCNKEIDEKFKHCYACNMKEKNIPKTCKGCEKIIDPKFTFCYRCFIKKT